MRKAEIEPGLLSLMRLTYAILLLWDGSDLLTLIINWDQHNYHMLWSLLSMFNEVVVLVVLYSGRLSYRLGRWYLTTALSIASVGTIMAQWFEIVGRIGRDIPLESPEPVDDLFALLFIPMIIIAVQYGFRGVIGFTLGTAALQMLLALCLVPIDRSVVTIPRDDVLMRMVVYPAVGFFVTRLVSGQKMERKALAEKNIELTRYAMTVERLATSHERNRLARELHDTLAHTLSAVAVQLEAYDAQLESDPEAAKQTLKQSRQLVRNGLQEARRAVQALRASPLEDLGLARAMHHLVDSVTERSGLPITLDMPDELDELPPEVEQGIYRITEEALNNTVRHANAQHAAVSLRRERGKIHLKITDDGFGFNLETVLPEGHYGLVGMRERALLCNGQLDIHSTPATGTTVRLTVGE